MAKIHIPKTTLFSICWGKDYFLLTLRAVVASLKTTSFQRKVILTDGDYITPEHKKIADLLEIEIVKRELNLEQYVDTDESRSIFSEVFLKSLAEFCDQEFIFTIQPDSCIIAPEKWSNKFLEYDYIGAAWPLEIITAMDMAYNKVDSIKNLVGNGGFSIRTKKYVETSLEMPTMHKNEDLNLCVFNYDSMVSRGINFAPIEVALDFAVEHPILKHKIFDRRFLLTYNSFGFHGEFNIAGMKYIHNNSKELI